MPKIKFRGGPPVRHEDIVLNLMFARSLGLKMVEKVPEHDRKLAIVGGGPSVIEHLEEIREFAKTGDVWGINGACRFLGEHGIDSTFISVDCHEIVAQWATGPIKKALLATRVHPSVIEALKGADTRLFELNNDSENGVHCCSSTASLGFDLATDLGYRSVVWYGCEGSYAGSTEEGATNADDQTHAYYEPQSKRDERMVVLCGGGEYLTAPDYYVQCCELAELIRKFPRYFSERSGGLLAAMVANPEHDITKVSIALMNILKPADQVGQSSAEPNDVPQNLIDEAKAATAALARHNATALKAA